MPELPEVQTILDELTLKIKDKNLLYLQELRENTIHTDNDSLLDVKILPKRKEYYPKNKDFGRIKDFFRRGKYLIIRTSKNIDFIVHLRMTGKLIFTENYNAEKKLSNHIRAIFFFDDNTVLLFDDIRTFGNVHILFNLDYEEKLCNLGVEPLSKDLTAKYLQKRIKNTSSSIKNLLLNQSIIAGLGNIYVNEILHRAKISPQRKGSSLSFSELRKVINQTQIVLKEALEKNGTTISNYRKVDNKTGEFQNFLRVYQKEKCPCGQLIKRIKQSGRSTFYCKKCQK